MISVAIFVSSLIIATYIMAISRQIKVLTKDDKYEALETAKQALEMVEWMPIHDPDTHDVLGQLCHWCHNKPHYATCVRERALREIKEIGGQS
jgi:hypothetical protein